MMSDDGRLATRIKVAVPDPSPVCQPSEHESHRVVPLIHKLSTEHDFCG